MRANTPGTVLLLVLALAGASGMTCAQEDEQPAAEQAGEEQQEAEQQPATPPPAGSADSPFEYESSEQISEDLSVSFPVDI